MSTQNSPLRFSPVRLSPLRPSSIRAGLRFLFSRFPVLVDLLRAAVVVLVAGPLFVLFGMRSPVPAPGSAAAALPPGRTTVTTTTITIPTHVVEPALVREFNATYNMPYYRLDRGRYDPNRVENRTFTLIVLENDYLKLSILPELGGRIYQAIFKPTGNNEFYQNPVLKPSPWGPPEMGWWLAAGGMEWGLPVEEHGYEWGIPWRYAISDLADGVRVTVWDTDADDRLRAMIAITLLDGQALFHISPSIENPTDHPVDYKFWLNAMLAPGPANAPSADLRFIMPTNQVTVHSSGDPRLPDAWSGMSWPEYNGVDWSRLGNWHQWFGFFQRPQAAGDFQAVYDEGYDEGVVRAYNSGVARGAKFFGFGWGQDALPPDLYTDDDSSYVEMHGGLAPTFAETYRLSAGQRVTWNEQWYPVAGMGGLTWANAQVALHLESRPGETRLHAVTSSPRPNVQVLLLRRDNNTLLFEETVAQTLPGQPYHSPWISTPGLSPSNLAILVYSGQMLLGAYQYEGELPFPTPTATVTPGPTPTSAPSWEGHILRQLPIGGWSSVVRVWVRGQYGLPVTIAAADDGWSSVNFVGSKPEYGPDALEFAPLGPGRYIITPRGLGVSVTLDLPPGRIAQVLFEQSGPGTPLPTPTARPTLTPTPPPGVWRVRIPTNTTIPGTWFGVVRVSVQGQVGTLVRISSADGSWSTTNRTGPKPDYGPTFLEFAPLGAGSYVIGAEGIPVSANLELGQGGLAVVLFER
ncbi:MAG: DUF5107 domain-containing protein [Anaerolineae bacterium]